MARNSFSDYTAFTAKQLRNRIKWIEKLIARDGEEKHAFYVKDLTLVKAELATRSTAN